MKHTKIMLTTMENQFLLGDSLEILKQLPTNSIDLIFADPPYWMRTSGKLKRVEGTTYQGVEDDWDIFSSTAEYNEFTRKWLSECQRILKKDGSIWVIGGMQCIYSIGGIMQDLGYWIINDVIWHKSNPTPNFHGTRLNNSHETLIWATKDEKSKYHFNYKTAKELNDCEETILPSHNTKKQMGSVWKIPVSSGNERLKNELGQKLHSTQKPASLLYRIISISSKIGDIVLDPFAGTMTTGAMAKKLGRKYIMIEKDEKYFLAGKERVEAIEEELNDIAKAIYDIVPPRVSISEMIEKEYLTEGEHLYLKGELTKASFLKDGNILIEGVISNIHSYAAKLLGRNVERVNGFDYWFVKREGSLKSLKSIRDSYRLNEIAEK